MKKSQPAFQSSLLDMARIDFKPSIKKKPHRAKTVLGSFDAKQCPFRNRKENGTISAEKKTIKAALTLEVPVPLKLNKMRERPK